MAGWGALGTVSVGNNGRILEVGRDEAVNMVLVLKDTGLQAPNGENGRVLLFLFNRPQ